MRKVWCMGVAIVLTALMCGCTAQEQPDYTIPEISMPSGYEEIAVAETVAEGEPPAEQLEITVSRNSDKFTDGKYTTKVELKEETEITVTADMAMGSLYLIWDKDPGRWWLTVDGKDLLCGENGFFHEYIRLDRAATAVTIHAPAGSVLCDIYAFTPGTVPDWVQLWQPPWDEADLLVIPTHADDEYIFFGGLLPYYAAERDLKVQVAYMVDHSVTASYRSHELLNGLWNVGIRAYPVIGPFGGYKAYTVIQAKKVLPWDAVVAYHVELLRRFKPSVVVTHDLKGEYGHPIHIVNAQAAVEAVELASDAVNYPESAEKYGTWDLPKLYLHLYGDNETVMDWDMPLDSFDGMTAFEVAEVGWAAHKSQHGYSFVVYKKGHKYDGRLFGLYRTTVGEDVVGGDLFENITTYY